jgi:hypothetical protein
MRVAQRNSSASFVRSMPCTDWTDDRQNGEVVLKNLGEGGLREKAYSCVQQVLLPYVTACTACCTAAGSRLRHCLHFSSGAAVHVHCLSELWI